MKRVFKGESPQYFEEWKAAAVRAGEQHDMDWIEENLPAVWLLLQMIDE